MIETTMVYKPSPKPDYAKSTLIKYSAIKIHMWGDEISGYVKDWIYVSNKHLHQIIFGLKPGSNFKHSQSFRTIFGADEFLYVLSGFAGFLSWGQWLDHPWRQG